jgi:hypothetical protein
VGWDTVTDLAALIVTLVRDREEAIERNGIEEFKRQQI